MGSSSSSVVTWVTLSQAFDAGTAPSFHNGLLPPFGTLWNPPLPLPTPVTPCPPPSTYRPKTKNYSLTQQEGQACDGLFLLVCRHVSHECQVLDQPT